MNRLSEIAFAGGFFYCSYCINGSGFTKMPTPLLIFIELVLLIFCEFSSISQFKARKLCHAFSGLMMLHLNPVDLLARYFVYSVAITSLIMVWELGVKFKFRYARAFDVGISVYLVIVVLFFYHQIPIEIIVPVFFADPLGAIVGRGLTENNFRNPKWAGEKTVGGTCAVFIGALLTLSYGSWVQKFFMAAAIAFAEGMSKEYDNLLIAALVMIGYYFLPMEMQTN